MVTCEPSVVETRSQVDSGRIYQWIVDKSLTNWIGNLYLTSWISKQWIFNRYLSQGLVTWLFTSPQEEVNNCDLHNFVIFSDSARLNTAAALWYSLQQSTSGLSDLYRLHFATELIDGTLIINMLLIQKLLLEVMMCLFQCKHVFSNKVQGPNLHSLQSFKLLKQEW